MSFRYSIEAWQLAREVTRKVYRLTKKPKFVKDYVLRKQVQSSRFKGSGLVVFKNLTLNFEPGTCKQLSQKNMKSARQPTLNREP